MDQKKKALGRGLEQLFDSEVLEYNVVVNNETNTGNNLQKG